MNTTQAPSASIAQPDYWWYRARSGLLRSVLAPYLVTGGTVLDVGSADGPSVSWMRERAQQYVPLDIDPQGLSEGGVCGSALGLPFRDSVFDVVSAFDVVEHCDPEAGALAEFRRILVPGGRLLLAVPAYAWAWSQFDVDAGHHRRYTRKRLVDALESAGFDVERSTYVFGSTFPLFVAERLMRKIRQRRGVESPDLTPLPDWVDQTLTRVCAKEARVLAGRNLPFGSSVVAAATRR